MALLRGYTAVPGTKRQVRAPSGELLSHRAYRNLVVQKAGWRNLSEMENSQEWARFKFRARQENRKVNVTYSSPLARDFARVKRKRARTRKRKIEKAGRKWKNTPLGRLLLAEGHGEPDTEWREGGTP